MQLQRYLGYVYESSLNDYDGALEHFNAALAGAQHYKLGDVIPGALDAIHDAFGPLPKPDRARLKTLAQMVGS